MKRLIRKIIKEQISVYDFCLPVAGWGGSLAGDQVFWACRSKKVEKQADPKDTCKKCKRCTTDCIKCNCCRRHKGVDLVVGSGTDVKAPQAGTVVYSHITSDGCGGYIRIDHGDGIETKYCHLKERLVEKYDEVIKGQVIGVSGGNANDVGNGNSTHAHLHYEVLKNSSAIDPKSNGYLDNEVCGTEDIIVIDDEEIDDEDIIITPPQNPKLVRAIQNKLQLAGYLVYDTYILGELDEITIEAIKEVQETHGLTVTGIMDKETYLALKGDVYD